MSSSFHHSEKVPALKTERLTLRGHRLDDFAHCAAMWADPLVTRYIGGKPLTEEECWSRLLRYVGHWAWLGFGYWVAEERATGELVGEIGFADHKRDLEPSLKGVPEIGWVLASHAHGRGYATEAIRRKYWMFRPIIELGRFLVAIGLMRDNTGSFEVTLAG